MSCNEKEEILERTQELLTELIRVNNMCLPDIGAVIFSATPDVTAVFPAAAARRIGWTEVPLFDAQQIDCDTGLPRCIRVLILWNTNASQDAVRHVYLHEAKSLRPDLVSHG